MTQANGKQNLIRGRQRTISIPDIGILFDWGITVPPDGSTGYAPGCIFQDVDAAEDAQIYVNAGSNTSSDFNAIDAGAITAADIDVVDAGGFYTATTVEAILAELGGATFTNRFTASANLYGATAATAANFGTFFVATTACIVKKVSCTYSNVGSSGALVQVERAQGTEANGAGDDLLTNNTNTGFDLTATANTVQVGTLVAEATRTLAVGDRLNIVDAGTLTNLADLTISVEVETVVA